MVGEPDAIVGEGAVVVHFENHAPAPAQGSSGVYLGVQPLACIFGISRLYFTCIPPVSQRILGIPCIPVSIYI